MRMELLRKGRGGSRTINRGGRETLYVVTGHVHPWTLQKTTPSFYCFHSGKSKKIASPHIGVTYALMELQIIISYRQIIIRLLSNFYKHNHKSLIATISSTNTIIKSINHF